VPERVWAAAEAANKRAHNERVAAVRADFGSLVKTTPFTAANPLRERRR
jgi:hypothetical protein